VQGKRKYCSVHHRAYECISRQALKGSSDANETPESKAFKSIFGYKREAGIQSLSQRVLLEYCERFPEGKEKSRQARGSLNLASFVESQGYRRSEEMENVIGHPIDEEAFFMKVPMIRPWQTDRVKQEWEMLKCDTAIKRDWKGPPYNPLRLFIPGWYLAEDKEIERGQSFQERRLDQSSKSVKVSDSQRAQMLDEASKGFTKNKKFSVDEMTKPLAATAMTSTKEVEACSGMDLLKEMANQYLEPDKSPQASPRAASSPAENSIAKPAPLTGVNPSPQKV
jgi:hypothetical protein